MPGDHKVGGANQGERRDGRKGMLMKGLGTQNASSSSDRRSYRWKG